MARPALQLGSHGKITTWPEGARFVARAQFRDYDGVVRFVKRNGRTKAAAERALREALTERQAPVKAASVSPTAKVFVVAEMWLREVERLVDASVAVPGRSTPIAAFIVGTWTRRWVHCGSVRSPHRWLIGCWPRSRSGRSAMRAPLAL